jgi:mono/diheme cytochrome c family protein
MHAPVSTFEHNGRQYVLAYSAGSALIGSARGDSVWLFGLDGTLGPVEPGRPVSRLAAAPPEPARQSERSGQLRPGPVPPLPAAAADRTAGKRLYEQACALCHGGDGRGGHGVGAPLVGVKDLESVIETVTAGRNDMPPFRTVFSPEQIRDVGAYVIEELAGPTR